MSEIDEGAFDRHYLQQQRALSAICAQHRNQTDLAIVEKWQKIFDKTPSHEKLERSCLMLLMYRQLREEGRLGKPFTDMRNCTLELTQVLREYDNQRKTIDERPKANEISSVKVVDVLLAPPRPRTTTTTQSMAQNECLKTYDSHTNCCLLHYNGQRPILGETALRLRAPHKEANVHMDRLCSGGIGIAVDMRSLGSKMNDNRGNADMEMGSAPILDIGSLRTNCLYDVKATHNCVKAKELHNNEHLKLEEKKSVLAVHKTVSCDDCCRKRSCPCIADMTDSANRAEEPKPAYVATFSCRCCTLAQQCEACCLRQENDALARKVAALRLELQSKADLQQRVKQCLESTELKTFDQRMTRLRRQIINSARIGIRRIKDWHCEPGEQINILITTFGKLTDDEKFKSKLHAFDRRLERVLLSALELEADRREYRIKLDFKDVLKRKFKEKRERAEKRLKMQVAVEQQHQQLAKMTHMTMLKKLFLDKCMGKVEHASCVLRRLDQEYEQLAKQL